MFRRKIVTFTLNAGGLFFGEIECDESYFGAKRIRGKKGHGAAGKFRCLVCLKGVIKVYDKIIKNCSKEQLMPII